MLLFVFFSVLSIVASENEVIMRPREGSLRRMLYLLFWNVWKSLPYNYFSTICLSDCWVFVCWLFWRWWWSGQFKSWLLRSGCFLQIPLSFGGDLAAWKAALLMFFFISYLNCYCCFFFCLLQFLYPLEVTLLRRWKTTLEQFPMGYSSASFTIAKDIL